MLIYAQCRNISLDTPFLILETDAHFKTQEMHSVHSRLLLTVKSILIAFDTDNA